MKILISVDMEGITGVVSQSHTDPAHAEYQRFRKLMTADANAAVEGALAGGATDIVVTDAHANMDNILIEELNPAVEFVDISNGAAGVMVTLPDAGVRPVPLTTMA